jgi:flavin reductase (DIM6/NTAB) family NADH-FMN oxidoreductase RutF
LPAKVKLGTCYRPIYPSPAALVTTVSESGAPNIIALGEVFNISIESPVIVGIAVRPQRYSYELLLRVREFVVNLPPASLLPQVLACGRCSGRDTDKFALTGLTALAGDHVRPPLIAECPVNLECRVLDIRRIGDHDLITGLVLAEHVDASVLGPDGEVDVSRLDAFAMIRGDFRRVADRV